MIECVQYNATLAITGAIKGSYRERLYQEHGLDSFIDRRWYRRLVKFYKTITNNSPECLHYFYLKSNNPVILQEVSY